MTGYVPTEGEVRGRHNANATLDAMTWRMADAQFDRWLASHDESVFRAAWLSSGEGFNGEYPDEGVAWGASAGYEAFHRWMSDPQRRNGE